MKTVKELSNKLDELEAIEQEQEPGVIICEPDQVDHLKALHPNAVLLIDNVPKVNISEYITTEKADQVSEKVG